MGKGEGANRRKNSKQMRPPKKQALEGSAPSGVSSGSSGARGSLPVGFNVVDERIFRHQDPSENKDREWRVLILYSHSKNIVRVQRYHARWGNKLRPTPPVEDHSKEEWSAVNLSSALEESDKFMNAKIKKGYICTTHPQHPYPVFNEAEVDSKIVELKNALSNPGAPATIDADELSSPLTF